MKRSLATLFLGALCASLCSSCVTDGSKMNDHWNPSSMPSRMQRTLTGYDASRDGSVTEWLASDANSIGLTLQRHLLGFNPDNPNEEEESTFSYNYIETQFGVLDLDGNDEDAELAGVSILADLVGGTFLRVEGLKVSSTKINGSEVSETSLSMGLGFRLPLSDVMDIYGIGSYLNVEDQGGPPANSSEEGRFGVTAGLRYRLATSVELGAAYDWTSPIDGVAKNEFSLSGFVDVYEPVSLGAQVLISDNAEMVTMGLRIHF